MKECLNCGKLHNNTKFCSRLCQKQNVIKFATKISLSKRGGRIEQKKCIICGGIFQPQKRDGLYCGNSCASKPKVIKQKQMAKEISNKRYEIIIKYVNNLNRSEDFSFENICSLLSITTRSTIDIVLGSHKTNLRTLLNNKFGIGYYKQLTEAEKLFKQIDKVLDIKGEREKTFDDLLSENGNKLRLDWYSKEYNLIIEYNGRQHYTPIYGIDNLIISTKRELIRLEYCKNKNINILIIPYTFNGSIHQLLSPMLISSQAHRIYTNVDEKVQRLMVEDIESNKTNTSAGHPNIIFQFV